MQVELNTNIDRIIAKIDNDFGLDNTDWVPRIAAWVTDALAILKCTPTEKKKATVPVYNNVAVLPCGVVADGIKVYDSNGCEVEKYDESSCGCSASSTGEESQSISNTLEYTENANGSDVENVSTVDYMDNDTHALYHNVREYSISRPRAKHYFVIDSNKIELDYEADTVTIQYTAVKTIKSDVYKVYLPVVPNNGLLIEAVTYYCMYKILCRGQKHPVFNLAASQYGTNPYYMWTSLQEKVKRSVMADAQGNILEEDGDLWDRAIALFSFD